MKKLAKVLSLLLVVAVLATSLCACSSGEKEDGTVTVKLGLVGEDTRHWDKVKENLAKDGIILEYVNFSEYVLPNRALNEGEIDLNAAGTQNTYAKYDLNRDGKIDSKDVAYVLVSWNN